MYMYRKGRANKRRFFQNMENACEASKIPIGCFINISPFLLFTLIYGCNNKLSINPGVVVARDTQSW